MPIDPLLNQYDIYYINSSAAKRGFMLAVKDGRKAWERNDLRTIPDSYPTEDIGYANLPPDVQAVLPHQFFHGGLGAREYQVDDDSVFQKMRFLRAQDVDTRCKGKVYPGPKIVTLTLPTLPGLTDGGMEIWTDPNTLTNWTKAGTGTFSQEATIKYSGAYSAKFTGNALDSLTLTQTLSDWATAFRSKLFSVSYRLRTPTASGAGTGVTISINDGVGTTTGASRLGQSALTGNANAGQKDVAVVAGATFLVGESVRIEDTAGSEDCVIAAINVNTLTMRDNLTNSYTTARSAIVAWPKITVSRVLDVAATRVQIILTFTTADPGTLVAYADLVEIGINDVGVTFCDFNGKTYLALGRTLLSLSTPFTAFAMEGIFPHAITALEVFGDYLYVGQGGDNKYWYIGKTIGGYTVSTLGVGEGEADLLCRVGATFHKVVLPNSARSSADPTNAGSWTAATLIGTSDYNVRSIKSYLDLPYFMKEDGAYYMDSGGTVRDPFPGLHSIANTNGGKNADVFLSRLYFGQGVQQEYEIDTTTLTELTPADFAQGVSQYEYRIVARAHDESWLYALMYRGANDIAVLAGRWEYLAGQVRWVWHDIRKITGVTSVACAFVSALEGRPYLYIASTVAGEAPLKIYLPNTTDATADSGYRFVTSGSIWLPRETTKLIRATKRWQEVYIKGSNLSATKKISFSYSTDDGSTFGTAVDVIASGGVANALTAVSAAMLNLKLDFASDSESSVPVLDYLDVKTVAIMPSVVKFRHSIFCADKLQLKNRHTGPARAPTATTFPKTDQIAFINGIRDSICTLCDPWGTEHTVRVHVLKDTPVNDEDNENPDVVYQIEATKL